MGIAINKMRYLLAAVIALTGLFILTVSPSAEAEAASAHELNYFQYETYTHEGRDWLRIELGIKGGRAEFASDVRELTPQQLHISLLNTSRGGVRSDIALDKKIAKYLTLRQTADNTLDIMVSLNKPVADQAYKLYTAEADKKGKKPYRLVIEIAADKLTSEYEADGPKAPDTLKGLQGRKIVLDPGHGGSDSGARGPGGLLEKDAALAIAKNIERILRSSGAIVTMTRTDDRDVYGPLASDRNELQARVDVGNADPGNEIFVSIHCDAFTSPTAHGTSAFYYQPSFRGKLLAESIHNEIVAATDLASRGAKAARFYVLRNSSMPATLIETAFISNYQEEALLGNPEFQYKIALAVCRGICQYFRMR